MILPLRLRSKLLQSYLPLLQHLRQLTHNVPGPHAPLDPLSTDFLSDLSHCTDMVCTWITGVGIALNCRMLLGFSGYQEYEVASRLSECTADFAAVHRAVSQACGKYRRVRAWFLFVIIGGKLIPFCSLFLWRTQEAKEAFARILVPT